MLTDVKKNPTRVLIIHNILWSPYKAPVFTDLAKRCRESEFELLVLHLAPRGQGQHRFGETDGTRHAYPFKVLTDRHYENIAWWKIFFRLLREIRTFHPKVIVLPGYGALSAFLLAAVRFLGIVAIMAVDSTEYDCQRSPWKEFLKKRIVRRCDAFFSFGTRTERYLRRLGVEPQKIFSPCQASDNEVVARIALRAAQNREQSRLRLKLAPRNFVFVGRFVPVKNLPTLFNAFKELKTSCPMAAGWGLVLVGDGEEKTKLEAMVAASRIKDVVFLGGKAWSEVPEILALCDVLVLPSFSEPWGMVVNEAMACGMPVLVSSACGVVEDLVVPGGNGFCFNPDDVEELKKRMREFVEGKVDLQQMGQNSVKIISEFGPAAAANKMLEGIKSVVSQREV